jgi:phosphoesterase RecJ-like protein
MDSPLRTVAEVFRTHHTFVLTTHVNPDGDAIGSEAALADALRRDRKSVEIVNHSPTPAIYDFLDPDRTIRVYQPTRDRALLEETEVIVVLDANQPDRLRSMEHDVIHSRANVVCIDHHLDPHPFARHYLIDDGATSTAEILFRLITHLYGTRLSAFTASALYTAIMTDTGSFRYPRVDAETHRMVANLIECGADPVGIYSRVYERWTDGRLQLLGETLSKLKTDSEGKIAYVTITQDMLRRTGTSEEDTDNFTTYPMSIGGVRAGILFLELSDGVKISFRSRGEIPINELAREFGGNGHANAAGARMSGASLEEIEQRVVHAARKYV